MFSLLALCNECPFPNVEKAQNFVVNKTHLFPTTFNAYTARHKISHSVQSRSTYNHVVIKLSLSTHGGEFSFMGHHVYEVASKIFRTDAVKIIKLTIRPIGRHHTRSSSLPHVGIGPTVSSIFETLPGNPFLSECQALSAI
jgi:hypothetical protein